MWSAQTGRDTDVFVEGTGDGALVRLPVRWEVDAA
jgi:hypothetical protein